MGKITFKLKKEHLTMGTIFLSAVLFLGLVGQIRTHLHWSRWISRTLVAQTVQDDTPETQPATAPATQAASPAQELHPSIKKRNIFGPPTPKGHGMTLTGVLGDFALFKTRAGKDIAIEEGKSAEGVTVKSIHHYQVVIEFQGNTETLHFHRN